MFRSNLWILVIICLALSGCAGWGFDKKATVVPDKIILQYNDYDENPKSNYVRVGAEWNLKEEK